MPLIKRPAPFHTHVLSDGRKLCYQLFGDPRGFPVFYCHGFPGSRLEAKVAHDASASLGLCLIAVDRPGFGQSDFQPGRQMRDWVSDIATLAAALSYNQFSVLGVSGGSPYAMLMAEHLSRQVHRLGIVCGLNNLANPEWDKFMGSAQRSAIKFARMFPRVALFLNRYPHATLIRQFPNTALKLALADAPKVDHEVLNIHGNREMILASIAEAFAHGGHGPAWDFYLATQQWQANPAAVKTATFLWYGDKDTTVPIAMGEHTAALMPNCTPQFLANEGHFSLPFKHAKAILAQLKP